MAVQDKSTSSFPLVFIQPVADFHYSWTALSLHVSPFDDHNGELFPRFFNEFGLGEALEGLSCILPVAHPSKFAGAFGAPPNNRHLRLRIPVEQCVDTRQYPTLERLRQMGYDLIADGLPPRDAQFPDCIDSIAIDCSAGIPAAAVVWLHRLRGPHIAENVADLVAFDACRAAGFRRFSGDYPLLPQADVTPKDAISRARLVKLLQLVAHDADVAALESLLKQDPALSYQLFKLVSSAAFGFTAHIANFTQAINLLGRRQLQRWLQLLLYARFPGDESINPLLPRAAARAGLMEALCKELDGDRDEQDRAFIVGMFSLLDILLAQPLRKIIESLILPTDVVDALMHRRGRLGRLLDVVERAEYGRMPLRHSDLQSAGISAEAYCRSLMQAYRWATQVSREV